MDACPGRLNQTTVFPNREGVFLWSMLRDLWSKSRIYAYRC
jgi:hypothetical protein